MLHLLSYLLPVLCYNAVKDIKNLLDKNPARQIGTAIENLLKTGRLATQSGLDLQQVLRMLCLLVCMA